jgi:chromosome segregation ATPase
MLDCHPEVIKFAQESAQLKTRMSQLDSFMNNLKIHEAALAKARKYSEILSQQYTKAKNQIVQLEQRERHSDGVRGGDEIRGEEDTANDEIPVQQVSSESLMTLCKSDNGLNADAGLGSKFEQLACASSINSSSANIGKRKRFDQVDDTTNESIEELLAMQEKLEQKICKLETENQMLRDGLEDIRGAAKTEADAAKTLQGDLQNEKKRYEEKMMLMKNQFAESCKKLEDALGDKNCLDSERRTLAATVENLRSTLTEVETQYHQTCDLLRDVRNEAALNQQKIRNLEEQISQLSGELSRYDPLKSYGSSTDEIVRRIEQGDQQQTLLQQRINRLEFTLQSAQQDNEELLSHIAKLSSSSTDREQLTAAQETVAHLHQEMETMQEEVLKLTRENDKLIKHSNMKQKLQYHVQIKEENNQFRVEIKHLRDELARLAQRNVELEDIYKSARTGHFSVGSDK